jgi:hypothetical protein
MMGSLKSIIRGRVRCFSRMSFAASYSSSAGARRVQFPVVWPGDGKLEFLNKLGNCLRRWLAFL